MTSTSHAQENSLGSSTRVDAYPSLKRSASVSVSVRQTSLRLVAYRLRTVSVLIDWTENCRSTMKKLLRVLALIVAVPLVLVGFAVAAGFYMNERAEHEAQSLCSSIKVGSAEAHAVALGRATSGRHLQAGNEHRFFFQGWVFNGTECAIRVNAGSVVSVAVATVGD